MTLMPRSLFGRLVLVMAAGLFMAQLLSVALHLVERQRTMARTTSEEIAERVAAVYRALDSKTGSEREQLAALLSARNLTARIEPAGSTALTSSNESGAFPAILRDTLGPDVTMNVRAAPRLGVVALDLRLEFSDGNWLHVLGAAPQQMFGWPIHLLVQPGGDVPVAAWLVLVCSAGE